MSALGSFLQSGLSMLESATAETSAVKGVTTPPQITVAGHVWPCTKTTLMKGQVGEVGGHVFEFDYAVHIRFDAKATDGAIFSDITLPLPEQLVTDGDVSYRIVKTDKGHGFLALFLVHPNARNQ